MTKDQKVHGDLYYDNNRHNGTVWMRVSTKEYVLFCGPEDADCGTVWTEGDPGVTWETHQFIGNIRKMLK